MDKILILFSGGIDSTGALYKSLNDKKHKVVAYHIHLINKENRHKAEAIACKNIISYLSKTFKFEYYESTVDMSAFKRLPWDTEICWCMGAMLAQRDFDIKFATTGRNLTDSMAGGSASPEERQRCDKIFKYITESPWRNFIGVENFPIIGHMTKKEVWDSLPKELQEMVWYCRTPIYSDDNIVECGNCSTCKEVEQIII